MPASERSVYETLLESDESGRQIVSEVSDDWSSLALLSRSTPPDSDLRRRTLLLTQEPEDLSRFLESPELNRLRDNYSKPGQRYLGGEGTVDLGEIKNIAIKDSLRRTYEHLLDILPIVCGDSPAAFGDFAQLRQFARDQFTDRQKPFRGHVHFPTLR